MIEYFKNLYKSIDLNERYTWKIDIDCPIYLPENLESNYQKNIYLKHNLGGELNRDISLATHYWLIKKWGGIKNFKENNKNDEKIRRV